MSDVKGWVLVRGAGGISELLTDERSCGTDTRLLPIVILTESVEGRDRVVHELKLCVEAARSAPPRRPGVVDVGELQIDMDAHRVTVDGNEVSLTALEFRLLATFVERRDCVQTRSVLLTDVWEISADNRTRTVDTHVKRLRDKLSTAGRFIQSVRGTGYRFSDRVRPPAKPPSQASQALVRAPSGRLALVPPGRVRVAAR